MSRGFSTRAVHGVRPSPREGPLEEPVVLSSAFALGSAEQAAGAFRGEDERWIYGRWGNPTVRAVEERVAALEGAQAALLTASGMAAITGALLAHLAAGDHVVAPRAFYGESARLLRERLVPFGIETSFVDGTDVAAYRAALRPTTRLLYAETPANPLLGVTALAPLAALAREQGLTLVVDNTFATPYCQRPLEHGAHLVVHSATKALSGHGDVVGGVVAGDRGRVARVADLVVKGLGAVLSPVSAFLLGRGLSTLALRQAAATRSASELAGWLERHPAVARVHYPGLASHPGHDVAAAQMAAFGSVLSFELTGGEAAARRVLDRVRLITHAVSLGDVRSLLTHPATTTASTMPAADREAAGIRPSLLRLSVGVEDVDDLLVDLSHALEG